MARVPLVIQLHPDRGPAVLLTPSSHELEQQFRTRLRRPATRLRLLASINRQLKDVAA